MDIAAQQIALDNDYASLDCELALFYGDPLDGGVELTSLDSPGYARASVPASAWNPTDADGVKTTDPITFPDPTDAWQTATHYQLFDGSTGWDSGELLEPLEVTEAGDGPVVIVSVFHDDIVQPAY